MRRRSAWSPRTSRRGCRWRGSRRPSGMAGCRLGSWRPRRSGAGRCARPFHRLPGPGLVEPPGPRLRRGPAPDRQRREDVRQVWFIAPVLAAGADQQTARGRPPGGPATSTAARESGRSDRRLCQRQPGPGERARGPAGAAPGCDLRRAGAGAATGHRPASTAAGSPPGIVPVARRAAASRGSCPSTADGKRKGEELRAPCHS